MPLLFLGAKAWAKAQMIPLIIAGALALIIGIKGWALHLRHEGERAEHQRQRDATAETDRRAQQASHAIEARITAAEAKAAEAGQSLVREILLPPLNVTVEHRAVLINPNACPDYSDAQLAKLKSINIGGR